MSIESRNDHLLQDNAIKRGVEKDLFKNLNTASSIQISKFLKVIDIGKPYILLYHSLFGMPTLVNREILTLFDDLDKWNFDSSEYSEDFIRKLRNHYFLIDKNISERNILQSWYDEYIKEAGAWKHLTSLDLLISEACNFGCPHCIFFNSMETWDHWRINKLMPFEKAASIVSEYVKIIVNNNQKSLDIHFGSAEPLLNWRNLQKIILHIEQEYPSFLKKFSLNTNLSLLDEEKALFLKNHKVDIHVSLDWEKDANDSIRITKKWEGTFDLILSKINLLKEIEYPISWISLTITNKNYHLVDSNFILFCKKLWLSNIAFDIDLLSMISLDNVSIEQIAEKMLDIYKVAEKNWIDAYWTRTAPFENIMTKSVLSWDTPYFCSAIKWKNLSVSRDWDVTLCSYTTTKIGNIHSRNFIDDGKLSTLVKNRTPWQSEYCKWCEIEWHCSGQCDVTREISENTNSYEILQTMCEYYKTVTRLLLEHELDKKSLENET